MAVPNDVIWKEESTGQKKRFRPQPFGTSASDQHDFFFFLFLRLCQWHMEVPGPGVESELQLQAFPAATAITKSEPHLRPMPQLAAMPDP